MTRLPRERFLRPAGTLTLVCLPERNIALEVTGLGRTIADSLDRVFARMGGRVVDRARLESVFTAR
jgi:hypothetical protein